MTLARLCALCFAALGLMVGPSSKEGSAAEPTASAPERLKVPKGFKVELLYTVPQASQGSWVSLTIDPKGRLIASDQYGKLYRITPPPLGAAPSSTKVEPLEVAIGEAQGLLWAFDSLYVVVNKGQKYASGLYRARDTDGDDQLDKVELLRGLKGGGEHGPHAVVLAPDGKSLYVVAGNGTALTELAGSLVPRIWDEDQILPRLPDGRGFMKDERAPAGCIYRVDPDGKDWVLVSMGYRNAYDIAFNRFGDLFTYDSDMEWDVNTPWYRPTRVCQAASGSDLGYRGGSGKFPPYYPESLPPVVEIGPGSPTGIAFGYPAAFPAKYREALYICDWSYGKLYTVFLEPQGSGYKATLEEFITGTPLPLTDLQFNPNDGALYFAIGGRRVLSGLYRVTYVGAESTQPPPADSRGANLRALRHRLESFHGRKDPSAIDAAWPHLGHADRFVRYAARVAIETQDPALWEERALEPQASPQAALTALLAVSRAGQKSLQPRILAALDKLGWGGLTLTHKLELLRVYELALIRMGSPGPETATRLVSKFDNVFPAGRREVDAELCKLLVFLQAPAAASKGMTLLERAPTQEDQIEYAAALRFLRKGWTPALREAYFSWFLKAAGYKGGASIQGFMKEIKDDAVATLDPEEKKSLAPLLEAKPKGAATAAAPPRPFVRAWTVNELAPLVERGLSGRDFERGRALFGAASCFACHRFANEGGTVGPDLTGVAGRFSARDLLESIILPSKSISDQYQAVNIALADGRVVSGRIVNLHGNNMSVNTNMLDPNGQTNVDVRQVEEIVPSPVSMMPEGALNTLNQEEVLDLMAYLLSGGQPDHAVYRKAKAAAGAGGR